MITQLTHYHYKIETMKQEQSVLKVPHLRVSNVIITTNPFTWHVQRSGRRQEGHYS